MKVVFTIDSLQQGGAEQSLVHLIEHFPKDIQVVVVYLYHKETLLPALEKTGCTIISLKLKGRLKWIEGISQLKKIIQTHNPDIMVSCLYESNIISRWVSKSTGTPLIGTLVSDSYSNVRTSSFGWKKRIAFYFYFLLDRFTTGIPVAWIANSQSIKKTNAEKLRIPDSRIEVVYRGRNVSEYSEWQKPEMDKGFRFAFIGRLMETKGLKELILAFKNIEQTTPDIRLDIYGEGPFRSELETLIREQALKSKVIIHGNVQQAWKQLYQYHVFVFPSWVEGFSGALVEAMMVGLPIIASDISMNLEAVEAGVTAEVHRVKDLLHLTEKMRHVMLNYNASIELGKRARMRAFDCFELKNIAIHYSNVLRDNCK